MSTPLNASELARETLKKLAARKLSPTPENYSMVYQEMAVSHGAQIAAPVPAAENDPPKTPPPWPTLIRELLKQLDTAHRGILLSRKKESLQTVLNRFSSNSDTLFDKLQGLMKSWAEAPIVPAFNASDMAPLEAESTNGLDPVAAQDERPAPEPKPDAELAVVLRELLAKTLETAPGSQSDLSLKTTDLAEQVRAASDHEQISRLSERLRRHWGELEFRDSERASNQEGLVRLLRLLINNVSELTPDGQWLNGQVAVLKDIITRPMDKKAIADAERNLRDTIVKQGSLQNGLVDARSTLKNLLTSFIDRVAEVTEQTGEYHSKIEDFSQKIGNTDNIDDLGLLLDEIMIETRAVQNSARKSHEELVSTRKQAQDAEQRVKELEHELERASEKMHEDQLTGALNRRGMDEALSREISRSDRQLTPICLALLDIDDFKQLNDTLGHQVGDQSLIHLTSVIKQTLRPTDSVARYGGEEFIIIMSETGLPEAVASVTRLQRELTKKLFLHNDTRKLITFSAGVAQRNDSETADDLIGRADKSMYQAKKCGKNRVVAAD